eukprot:scaffold1218_cov175-Alexandrium_tamarense.AAC.7
MSRRGPRSKIPSALPASVSTSISKAVFRLLREEDMLEAQMNATTFPGCRRSSRLENESMPERKFRIHVAIQICSLVRGYQECLFFVSASQPVFNRDRFLRQAPALFEDKRPSVLIDNNYSDRTQKILSPRSKRFLSVLVNSQHFHQLLERLSEEETAFFHEVMESIEPDDDLGSGTKNYFSTVFGTSACEEVAERLYDSLEQIEHKIPTYRVDREYRPPGNIKWQEEDDEFKLDYDLGINDAFWFDDTDKTPSISFTFSVLKPIMVDQTNNSAASGGDAGVHALSLEYLVELEKNPWRYNNMLQMPPCAGADNEENKEGDNLCHEVEPIEVRKRTKLREAIGDRRFRAWKIANDHKDDEDIQATPVIDKSDADKAFDLSSILTSLPEPPLEGRGHDTQPQADANDRNKVRRCLELAFGSGQDSADFQENGRDLIVDAEAALRNSSAQRYLFSVLSQRNRIEKQRSTRMVVDSKQRSTNQQSVSRLELSAFECVVRLCYAVLEANMEEQNYESAYRLLSYTVGFCTTTASRGVQGDQKTIFMTERIKIHPIFADLRLWERVLLLHQQDQQNDKKDDTHAAVDSEEQSRTDSTEGEDTGDNDAYDAAVSTLYEMVGYGVPAEELSRFATRISEEKGWFATEKGQALLVLARRLTAKRDEDGANAGEGDDFALGSRAKAGSDGVGFHRANSLGGGASTGSDELDSEEIAWSHPSTVLLSRHETGARAFLGSMLGGVAAEHQAAYGGNPNATITHAHGPNISGGVYDARGYTGRVAITAMTSFGSTAVITGGVDGSIFLAHTLHFGTGRSEFESNCTALSSCSSPLHAQSSLVNGVKLSWGAKGDVERDSGSGSISCLAASKGSGYRFGSGGDNTDIHSCGDEDEILASMDGCRIIGGTTGGGLRVWSLKDIYSASCLTRVESDATSLANRTHHGSGATSALTRSSADDLLQDAVAGCSIGGHRGGVTAIDVPPRMYRPDALLSGGEDGLIKLWSLKSSTNSSDGGVAQNSSIQSRFFSNRQIAAIPTTTDYDASDAQGVLTGHEGRIITIKTAWHGDKLLSGGADKTIRLWDLSGSTKPLSTLRGHQGWVTQTHFWGPHIIVSASTDRSIALWDIRAGSMPLFALRYHLSPISDLLLGNRSEPLMVSAGADGSLATWDFRVLSGPEESTPDTSRSSRTIRVPVASMNHLDQSSRAMNCGSVRLARAVGRHDFTFMSVCDDGIINEWDASSGGKISSHESGHRDAISGFSTFSSKDGLRQNKSSGGGSISTVGGTLTCSWDGTVRLRRLSRKSAR